MTHTQQIVVPGDCLDVLARMPADSVDAVVTDPPYGLSAEPDMAEVLRHWLAGENYKHVDRGGFMGRDWDSFVPGPDYWRAVYRVLKPGAVGFVFAGTRTQDLMSLSLSLAGFQLLDVFSWIYGSGFPKSLDVSKAIDKAKSPDHAALLKITAWIRERRDAAGITNAQIDTFFGKNGMAAHWTSTKSQPYCPTPEQWPALCSLLQVSTPPADVGALVLRIWQQTGKPGDSWYQRPVTGQHHKAAPGQLMRGLDAGMTTAEIDAKNTKEQRETPATADAARWLGWGTALKPANEPAIYVRKPGPGEAPALAYPPFVYSPKVSRKERDHGCEALPERTGGEATDREDGSDGLNSPRAGAGRGGGVRNHHPTVKPAAVMRALVTRAAAPGAIVLDPFCGSGSTGIACALEGRSFVGIEREDGSERDGAVSANYVEIARLRIEAAKRSTP